MKGELTFTGDSDGRRCRSSQIVYEWSGSLGCWFKSYERGRKLGEVRWIRGRLFRVAWVYDSPRSMWGFVFFTPWREVWWLPADEDGKYHPKKAKDAIGFLKEVIGAT